MSLIKWIRGGITQSARNPGIDQQDDLVQLAVTHFAKDFPNTQRDHCPALSTLDAMIQSQELPPDDVREHILGCSECFVYYREELARQREVRSTPATGAVNNIRKPRFEPVLIGSVAGVLVLAALLFLIVKERSKGVGEQANLNSTSITNSAPVAEKDKAVPQSAMAEPSSSQVPAQQEPSVPNGRNNSRSLIAQNKVTVDFEKYNPLRGAARPEHPRVLLRPTTNELTVRLAVGSPEGAYRVNLADAYGSTLQSVEATSHDGTQLRLELNLSSVKAGNYMICVAKETEIPQCVSSVVKPLRKK